MKLSVFVVLLTSLLAASLLAQGPIGPRKTSGHITVWRPTSAPNVATAYAVTDALETNLFAVRVQYAVNGVPKEREYVVKRARSLWTVGCIWTQLFWFTEDGVITDLDIKVDEAVFTDSATFNF